MERHLLGSPSWMSALHAAIRDLMRGEDLHGISYCFSETYLDPPRALSPGPIGWHLRVAGGELMLGDKPAEPATCAVVADYAVAEILAQPHADADAADVARQVARQASRDGRLRFSGGPPPHQVLPGLRDLHDRVAAITAAPATGATPPVARSRS